MHCQLLTVIGTVKFFVADMPLKPTKVLGCALLCLVGGEEACPDYGSDWTSVSLDPTISYHAHHKVVGATLHLRLEAASTGWLGFGIAEQSSGHMKGSDLVTAFVQGGQVRVDDRHAIFAPSTYALPLAVNGYAGLTALIDTSNDWTVLSGSEEGGRTKVWLTRAIDTGDSQDREVLSGPMRIVWAWGDSDTVAYHGARRGVGRTTFMGSAASDAIPAHDGTWEFHMGSFVVPAAITSYVCKSLRFDASRDRHVVAIRPLNGSSFAHHAVLHICSENAWFRAYQTARVCSSPLGDSSAGCSGIAWSWAVGMGDFILPPEAGIRIGSGPGKISRVILEVSYSFEPADYTHAHQIRSAI